MVLKSWDEVLEAVAVARNAGALMTNFFADATRMSPWCDDDSFSYARINSSLFLMHRQDGFSSLYFFAVTPRELELDLRQFLSGGFDFGEGNLLIDILGLDSVRLPLVSTFENCGFKVRAELQRMSRKTPQMEYEVSNDVHVATPDEGLQVYELLQKFFIPELEQLPTKTEIENWINAKTLYVISGDKNDVAGFVIFDLSKVSLYWRYWFVHPDYRNFKIGSKLTNTMFATSSKSKRQYFWVLTNNENAIIRHRHYGFEFEPMKDTILSILPERKT